MPRARNHATQLPPIVPAPNTATRFTVAGSIMNTSCVSSERRLPVRGLVDQLAVVARTGVFGQLPPRDAPPMVAQG
jgi:hypothetical protein